MARIEGGLHRKRGCRLIALAVGFSPLDHPLVRRGAVARGWVAAYVFLTIAPLLICLVQLDPGRGFWVDFSVALGFVGLSMLGLQFILVARVARLNNTFGPDVLLQFHRQMTVLVVTCLVAHPVILMLSDSDYRELLDFSAAPLRAKCGMLAAGLLVVLVLTSVWRTRIGLTYPRWQLLHAVLAVAVLALALAHVILVGYYVDQSWEKVLWVLYSVALVAVGVWVRIVKPLRRWRDRWRVVDVRQERHDVHTLVLKPNSPDTGPFRFAPGQFAWIHAGGSPFARTYHPFSISSSAERQDQVEFTIKSEGGFTTKVPTFEAGQAVFLDGPWGLFSMEQHEGPGFVFLGAGVGVTPLLSMVATLADRGDRRPCWMIVGTTRPDDLICADRISEIADGPLDLSVVQTASAAEPGWTGGRHGRIDQELLDEILPPDRHRLHYFICGPEGMMDAVERALAALGIPEERVHAERFAMV